MVKPWNSLPGFVVSSTTVQMFEPRLDKVWSNQPVFSATKKNSVSKSLSTVAENGDCRRKRHFWREIVAEVGDVASVGRLALWTG